MGEGLLMENWETKLPQEQQTKRLHSHQPHSRWDANSRCRGPHRKASISSFSPESGGSYSDRATPQLDKAKGGRIREPFCGEGKTQNASQNVLACLVEAQQWKGIGYHHIHSLKEPESYTFKEVNLKKKTLPFDKSKKQSKENLIIAKEKWVFGSNHNIFKAC